MLKRIILPLLLTLTSIPAFAGMEADHAADLARIQDYLNSLTTVTADFTQVAPDGSLTGGKFFLKRPGRMRWQYEPPTPLLMIANDSQIIYYDYDLQQLSYIPMNDSLVSFLARDKINLSDQFIRITDFSDKAGMVRITLMQTDKPEAGNIMLEFSDSPLLIRSMVITDAQKQVTTVSLNNAQFGQKLDNKLFRFEDPRKKRH